MASPSPTTLDDLADPVDGHDALDVLALLGTAAATVVATTALALATALSALGSAHEIFLFLEICGARACSLTRTAWSEGQAALADGVGEGRDAAVVLVASAVEDHGLD